MATLYTPAPKTEGLDWLAGMVRDSQRLQVSQEQVANEAKRIALAKQTLSMQAQQFWQTQARLKQQEDFQNRKFLYEVADDTRKFEWGQKVADRNNALATRAEDRLEKGVEWDMDPNNPDNKYREAATASAQAGTVRTNVETAETLQEMSAPSYWGTPDLPTGGGNTDSASPLLPSASNPLSPGTPAAGATGNPYAPATFTTPSGRQGEVVASTFDKRGRPSSYQTTFPKAETEDTKTWEEVRGATEDNLATLTKSLKPIPAYPTAPTGAEGTPEQVATYKQRKGEIETSNATVQRQIDELTARLDLGNRQERMEKTPLTDISITSPAFANVAPLVIEAYKRRDPIALENLRVQLQPLANDGDPSAKKVLEYMDKIRGTKVESKPKTPYF